MQTRIGNNRRHLVFLPILLGLVAACSEPDRPVTLDARAANGLAYDLAGSVEAGEPVVVLIHGSNLDRRMWDGAMSWLPDIATTLRYDQRGQGASNFPSEPFANHRDLLSLLDELGIGEATLVGLSAGAQIAVDAAFADPDRIRQLILVSPSLAGFEPDEMPPFFDDLMTALRAQDFAGATEVLLSSSIMAVPDDASQQVARMVKENERLWTIPFELVEQQTPALERLQELVQPTLVLTGVNDLRAVHEQGRLLEHRLSDVRHIHISKGGHLLNLTSPDAFRREVTAYLER